MFKYNDDFCFNDKIQDLGINKDLLPIHKSKVKEIINLLHNSKDQSKYKLIRDLNCGQEIAINGKHAKHIRESFEHVIIVGMGGAILNPMAILGLRTPEHDGPQIHFSCTTDPEKFTAIRALVNLSKTAVLTISKSGKTVETISLFAAWKNEFKKEIQKDFSKHFYFIVGEDENPIRQMAENLGGIILNHDPDIGGRFSGFTNVGILPGLIAGLDMKAFCEGSVDVLKGLWLHEEGSFQAKAALILHMLHFPMAVNMAYGERLAPFIEWYAQIQAESLGKDGRGITPIRATGPMDQHSQMQLFLGGPKDKLFTLFHYDKSEDKTEISKETIPDMLAGKKLSDIDNAEFQATLESLKANKLPVRDIYIQKLNEKALGALMMHVTLETIITGHLMDINPFDQPAVEQIKVKARNLLS